MMKELSPKLLNIIERIYDPNIDRCKRGVRKLKNAFDSIVGGLASIAQWNLLIRIAKEEKY